MNANLARCRSEQARCEAYMAANADDWPEGERVGVLMGWLDWGVEARMISREESRKGHYDAFLLIAKLWRKHSGGDGSDILTSVGLYAASISCDLPGIPGGTVERWWAK